MKKILLLASAVPVFILSGCVNKLNDAFDDIHVQTNTSLPAGSISITDSTIFAMSGVSKQLIPNQDGVLAFSLDEKMAIISDNLFDKLLKLPAQSLTFDKEIQGIGGLPITPGQLIPIEDLAPGGLSVDLDLGVQERIDKITFTGGFIEIIIANPNGYDLSKLICKTRNLTHNGIPLELRSGQRVDFSDGDQYELTAHDGNQFSIDFVGEIPYMTSISGSTNFFVSDMSYLEGNFGRKPIDNKASNISVPADFKNFVDKVGDIYFANPAFNIDFESGLEAPVILLIERIEAKMDNTQGSEQTLTLTLNPQSNRVYINNKGKVTLKIDNSSFVDGGDNLSTVLTKGLQSLALKTSMIINPTTVDIMGLGPDPLPDAQVVNQFYVDDKIDGLVNMSIPIDGVISNINMSNAIDINFSDLASDNNDFKDISIAFFGVNGLPLDMSLMASVHEGDTETGRPTNLFDTPVLIPASNGKKPGQTDYLPGLIPNTDMIIVKIKTELIDKLANSKKMFLDISGTTYQADQRANVKFYSPIKLNLNTLVGLKADFNVTPEN